MTVLRQSLIAANFHVLFVKISCFISNDYVHDIRRFCRVKYGLLENNYQLYNK